MTTNEEFIASLNASEKAEYRKLYQMVNKDRLLFSLLYDLDLLPEQLESRRDIFQLITIVKHWNKRRRRTVAKEQEA